MIIRREELAPEELEAVTGQPAPSGRVRIMRDCFGPGITRENKL
jgi:hypothetical protein